MLVVDYLADPSMGRTLNEDPSFERLRYLIVLAAASEPPFETSGTLIDGRATFNIKQLWRVATHLGLDFERFRGADRVFRHLEASGLVGSVRNEQTGFHKQYYLTEMGVSQTRLNIDRLSKIHQLESQAKTMHMTIKKQMSEQAPAVIEIALGAGIYSIGRDGKNDFSVDDPYMSSNHARVIHKSGRWTFEDLGSKNGSWKLEPQGLRRVTQSIINNGDMFQLGSTVFRFRQPDLPP